MKSDHDAPPIPCVYCLETILSGRFPALHTHGIHEMFFCAGASGWQRVEGRDLPMRRGDFHFFPAGHRHIGAGLPEKPCLALVINFADALFPPGAPGDGEACQIVRHLCRRAAAGHYRAPLEDATARRVRELFFDAIAEHNAKRPGYQIQEKALIAQILTLILRDSHHARDLQKILRPVGAQERVADVLAFVQNHYMNRIGIEDAAEIAHMSRSHFHAVFRREVGTTFLAYLNDTRLRHAAALLRGTKTPVAQVAQMCGFPCVSHFYDTFTGTMGCPPARFRRAPQEPTP